MSIEIHCVRNAEFPRLGWFAKASFNSGTVEVVCGSAVEHHDAWVVDGVWDGEFQDGNFHKADNFFGSGLRVDGDRIYFVASTAPVDRLFFCYIEDGISVSNSLIILLAMTGARLDSSHDYRKESKAIKEGIEAYEKSFPIVHPTIDSFYQVYAENLVVENRSIDFQIRRHPKEIGTFDQYFTLLHSAILRMRDNYEHKLREQKLVAFSTLSTGYDSSAVSCMVRDADVKDCFSYAGSWSRRSKGQTQYDASPIAAKLQLHIISLNALLAQPSVDELYLFASGPSGVQVPLLAMATYVKTHCHAAVVFTGYNGDVVWDANPRKWYLEGCLRRRGISGLDLAELRLVCGFINLPVPFLYAQNLSGIVEVSKSDEMQPWRLNNDYDRPIPRRILEQSGVTRNLFGMRKSAILTRQSLPTNSQLRNDFLLFLGERYGVGRWSMYFVLGVDRLCFMGLKYLIKLVPNGGPLATLRRSLLHRRDLLGEGDSLVWRSVNTRVLLYMWSVEVLVDDLQARLKLDRPTFTEPDDDKPGQPHSVNRLWNLETRERPLRKES